ncbi:hypothetical protein [Mesorhizobium sp. LSJC269B00]|uniref:hypothetical protein n=1 Tax=Mesorhizobium sp. LSJC269B00 TaxID=1287326 RepID=UPI0012EBD732|nr:hypothetical protein [Mesorhizobium sp. LSJC269B00]
MAATMPDFVHGLNRCLDGDYPVDKPIGEFSLAMIRSTVLGTRGDTMGFLGFINRLFPATEELRRYSAIAGPYSFMFLVKRIPAENRKFVRFRLSHMGAVQDSYTFSVEEFGSLVDAVLKTKAELDDPLLTSATQP